MLLSSKNHNKIPKYQFGIQRFKKFNGEEILVPIYRQKNKMGYWTNWEQIVKINDTYRLMDFDGEINLNENECIEYCQEYKKVIDSKYSDKIETSEIHTVEDPSLNNLDEKYILEMSKPKSKFLSIFSFLNL